MEAWVLSNYDRLSVFTKRPSHRDSSSRILLDCDLYRKLVDARPESSPVPEPPSGVVLLSAAACALGYTIGELTSKGRATNSLPWYRRFLLTSAFCGACLAFGVEFTAFCLRWVDELEQNAYAESMLRYEVIGGGFFGGLAPLRVGRQTNLSTVNLHTWLRCPVLVGTISQSLQRGSLQWCFHLASLHTRHGITICLEQTIQEKLLDKAMAAVTLTDGQLGPVLSQS